MCVFLCILFFCLLFMILVDWFWGFLFAWLVWGFLFDGLVWGFVGVFFFAVLFVRFLMGPEGEKN